MAKERTKEESREYYSKVYDKFSINEEVGKIPFDSLEGKEKFAALFKRGFTNVFSKFDKQAAEYLLEQNPRYAELFTGKGSNDLFISTLKYQWGPYDSRSSFLLEQNPKLINALFTDSGKEVFNGIINFSFNNKTDEILSFLRAKPELAKLLEGEKTIKALCDMIKHNDLNTLELFYILALHNPNLINEKGQFGRSILDNASMVSFEDSSARVANFLVEKFAFKLFEHTKYAAEAGNIFYQVWVNPEFIHTRENAESSSVLETIVELKYYDLIETILKTRGKEVGEDILELAIISGNTELFDITIEMPWLNSKESFFIIHDYMKWVGEAAEVNQQKLAIHIFEKYFYEYFDIGLPFYGYAIEVLKGNIEFIKGRLDLNINDVDSKGNTIMDKLLHVYTNAMGESIKSPILELMNTIKWQLGADDPQDIWLMDQVKDTNLSGEMTLFHIVNQY